MLLDSFTTNEDVSYCPKVMSRRFKMTDKSRKSAFFSIFDMTTNSSSVRGMSLSRQAIYKAAVSKDAMVLPRVRFAATTLRYMKAVLSTTLSGMANFVFIEFNSVKALLNETDERDLLLLSHIRSRLKSYFDFTERAFPAESLLVPITVESP